MCQRRGSTAGKDHPVCISLLCAVQFKKIQIILFQREKLSSRDAPTTSLLPALHPKSSAKQQP